MPAAASPPAGSPPQYSPALRRVTTGFGMGPGGAGALSATGTPDPLLQQTNDVNLRGTTTLSRDHGQATPQARSSACRTHTVHPKPFPRGPAPFGAGRPGWEVKQSIVTCPPSAIRTGRLRSVARRPPPAYRPGRLPGALPAFSSGGARLGVRFPLRCFQRFARPDVATRRCRGRDNRPTSGPSGPVLSYWGQPPPTPRPPAADRDRTVSRRSEPSSRTAFMGEQPNPWDLLQPQDATSRHRGAKPCRRCGLLGRISLLSPG